METNPFESPASVAAGPSVAVVVPAPRHGAVFMALIGLLLGTAVAAVFGALGTVILGLLFWLLEPTFPKEISVIPEVIIISLLGGGVYGGIGGGLVGVALGFATGLVRVTARRKYIQWAMIFSGFVGGVIGLFGGVILIYFHFVPPSNTMEYVLWPATGTLIGAAAGVAGGWVVGTLLARLCWGQSPPISVDSRGGDC